MLASKLSFAVLLIVVAACAANLSNAAELSPDLLPPVQVSTNEGPIDIQREGHSSPFMGDFDGDGRPDLMVGEYNQGRLRVYLNQGDAAEPVFGKYEWFQAGAELGRVPTG